MQQLHYKPIPCLFCALALVPYVLNFMLVFVILVVMLILYIQYLSYMCLFCPNTMFAESWTSSSTSLSGNPTIKPPTCSFAFIFIHLVCVLFVFIFVQILMYSMFAESWTSSSTSPVRKSQNQTTHMQFCFRLYTSCLCPVCVYFHIHSMLVHTCLYLWASVLCLYIRCLHYIL